MSKAPDNGAWLVVRAATRYAGRGGAKPPTRM